jgi:uncharacterized protein YwgA
MTTTEIIPVETGTDLILTLLFAGGERKKNNEEIVGNTRIDKLMFLLEKETTLEKYIHDFTFDAYNFGPYSSQLFDALQALVNAGLVKASPATETTESDAYLDEADRFQIEFQVEEGSESGKTVNEYSLTPEGEKVASALWQSLSKSEQDELGSIKSKFNSISLRKLLQYVYQKYPESTVNSVIKDQICSS